MLAFAPDVLMSAPAVFALAPDMTTCALSASGLGAAACIVAGPEPPHATSNVLNKHNNTRLGQLRIKSVQVPQLKSFFLVFVSPAALPETVAESDAMSSRPSLPWRHLYVVP